DAARRRQAAAGAPQSAADRGIELDRGAPLHGQQDLQGGTATQPCAAPGQRGSRHRGGTAADDLSHDADDELPLHHALAGEALMATRVLMVFDLPYAVSPDYDFAAEFSDPDGSYTENDVWHALRECGYEVHRLSLFDDVRPLLDAVRDLK